MKTHGLRLRRDSGIEFGLFCACTVGKTPVFYTGKSRTLVFLKWHPLDQLFEGGCDSMRLLIGSTCYYV